VNLQNRPGASPPSQYRAGRQHDVPVSQAAAGDPSLAQSFPRLARYRPALIVGLALFFVWEIITRSFTAYLAYENPELAVTLRHNQPTALVKLADRALNQKNEAQKPEDKRNESTSRSAKENTESVGSDSSDPAFLSTGKHTRQELDQIRAWAELALRNDPLNARALRILGQVAHQNSNEQLANALMRAAAERSLHEGVATYWSMLRSFEAGDYPTTLQYADILLRTFGQTRPYVNLVVARLAETAGVAVEVRKLLINNPPWRSQFLIDLPRGIADARTPLDIFLTLKSTPSPPQLPELKPYLDFLVKRDLHELAYFAWLQFLPAEQLTKVTRLFNGSFDYPPSGLPFDWVFSEGSGTSIQVTERPDEENNNALRIEFGPGRVNFGGITQLVLLPAGQYQLRGTHKPEILSERGLIWQILCGKTPIGESQPVLGTDLAWSEFVVPFTVPADCPLQTINLVLDARSASETFVSGSIWYDDLSITRDELAKLP
jgi:hypothetical protein